MDAQTIVGGVVLVAVVGYALHRVVALAVALVMVHARADAWVAKVLARVAANSVINLVSQISLF